MHRRPMIPMRSGARSVATLVAKAIPLASGGVFLQATSEPFDVESRRHSRCFVRASADELGAMPAPRSQRLPTTRPRFARCDAVHDPLVPQAYALAWPSVLRTSSPRVVSSAARWHLLYLLPLPHQHS